MNMSIIEQLEDLVHRRFNLKTLSEEVSKIFGKDVSIVNNTQIRLDNGDYDTDEDLSWDWNLMFNIEDGTENSGFYDIYFLPMRRAGYNKENMYITEIGYEFI